MGKRGPAKEPTKLKLIKGNPGKRPLNNAEPEFLGEAKLPEQVKNFPLALAEWNRRAPELIKLGILTEQDQTEFGDYCIQHGIYIDLLKKIRKVGIESAIVKGFYKAFQTASLQRLRLGAKFGFTPSDRSGIVAKPSEKPQGARKFLG